MSRGAWHRTRTFLLSSVVGLRDRALIGVMTYSFALVDAVVTMTVDDYYPEGRRFGSGFTRKAASAMKCRRNTSSRAISTNTLTRPASGKTAKRDALLSFSLNDWQDRRAHILRHDRVDVWRMIRRRVADAGMAFRIGKIGCHTFRATGIAAYDRTADVITLDEVERIVSPEKAILSFYNLRYGWVGPAYRSPSSAKCPPHVKRRWSSKKEPVG